MAVRALLGAHAARDDRLPPGRQLAQLGEVEVAVERERERARDRRGRHVQRVRAVALGEGCALLDAEAVLLVDDDQAQARELDARLEQGVRAHDERGVAGGDALQPRAALGRGQVARDHGHLDPERLDEGANGRGVLLHEHLGRGEQGAPAAPRSTARSIACTATTVLPEPTSPSSRRCIARPPRARSRSMSRTLRFWPDRERERQRGVVALEQLAGPPERLGGRARRPAARPARPAAAGAPRRPGGRPRSWRPRATAARAARRSRRVAAAGAGRCARRPAAGRRSPRCAAGAARRARAGRASRACARRRRRPRRRSCAAPPPPRRAPRARARRARARGPRAPSRAAAAAARAAACARGSPG